MTFSLERDSQPIRWNGISINVPVSWEAIVSGNTHLLFEDNFHPVLELRWERFVSLTGSKWRKVLNKWHRQLPPGALTKKQPLQLHKPSTRFDHTAYFEDAKTGQYGGIACDKKAGTVVLFQFFAPALKSKAAKESLHSLQCHRANDNRFQIQDFSLSLPSCYDLEQYSFRAGLTTLSFNGEDHKLQVCRLAQASARLATQPLETILMTLCGSASGKMKKDPAGTGCITLREPSLIKQILMRLKRQPPFLRGGLRHLPDCDRLFGFVAVGRRPIPEELQLTIYENFKPVQKR